MPRDGYRHWMRGRAYGIQEAAEEAARALREAGEDTRAADSLRERLLALRGTPALEETAAFEWTLRDEFAARAMQTTLANDLRPPASRSAAQAYSIADEMVAARGATGPEMEAAEAMRSACLAAALAVFDAPCGRFTRDQLAAAINGATPGETGGDRRRCKCPKDTPPGAPHVKTCPLRPGSVRQACVFAALAVVRRPGWTEEDLADAIEAVAL